MLKQLLLTAMASIAIVTASAQVKVNLDVDSDDSVTTDFAECNSWKQKEATRTFTLEDFTPIDLTESAEVVTTDHDIVGISREIRVVNDSIIALSQIKPDVNVILYNLRSGKYQVANRRGIGRLELTNLGNLSVDSNGDLIIAGVFDRKIISARWKPKGKKASIKLKSSPDDDCLRIVAGPGDSFIALPSSLHNKRMIVYGSNGKIVDSFGSFPSATLPNSVMPTNYLFQSDLACSPEAGKVAVSTMSWNEISICDLNGNHDEIKLKGPVFPELKIVSYGGSMDSGFPRPLWFMFSNASAAEDSFAVGYIGVEAKTDADFERGINSILEFDWNGQPQRRLLLPSEAMTFDIDYTNNILYTVENLPDPTLVRYNLKN